MPTLSVCMIVKNEGAFLEQCLLSIQGLVDEIVIVDTGSTDTTKAIALKYTSRVYDFPWCDDFAAARNESLKYATSDWILVLDADESLAKTDLNNVQSLISDAAANNSISGFVLIQRNYIKDIRDLQYFTASGMKVTGTTEHEAGLVYSTDDIYAESKGTAGWFPTPIIRLFRNNGGVKFTGVVHEDVSPSLPGKIVSTSIPIHHFGKMNPQTWKAKWELYERLAERKAAQENDYHAYYELGRQYLENQKMELAREMFAKSITLNDSFWLSWFNLGSIHLLQNNLAAARDCLQKAKELNPKALAVYGNLGVVYARLRLFSQAIDIFTASLSINPQQSGVLRNMSRCYEEMGDAIRAKFAWQKAQEMEKPIP